MSCWNFLDIPHGYCYNTDYLWYPESRNSSPQNTLMAKLKKLPMCFPMLMCPLTFTTFSTMVVQNAFVSIKTVWRRWGRCRWEWFASACSVTNVNLAYWKSINISWVFVYRTCAIIILYIINPLFEGQNIYLRGYYLKIHALNMIIIQERFGL